MASPPSPPIAHDPPVFPSHVPSCLVGSPDDLRKLVAQETQRHLQIIDENIRIVSKLRAFHNSLAPVNALPAELLSAIFIQLLSHADLIPKSPGERDHFPRRKVVPPTGNRDIVGAAAVCRYWRTVAIQNPWLWVLFPIHDRAGAEEFLARSKDWLVSLSLTRRFPSSHAPVLDPSVRRIRSLYISTEVANDIVLLATELSSPAPNLQELFVEHLPSSSFLTGHAVGRPARLPRMFDGEAPALRVLTLRGVPSPFRVLPPSLVHLDIGTSQSALPPFREFLRMLGGCPLLEVLHLCGAWPWDEFDHLHIARKEIALPKLGTIGLELEPQDAPGVLLSFLALPAHADVRISAVLEDGSNFGNILVAVDPSEAPLCFGGFRRLQLWRGGSWGLRAFRAADTLLDSPALDVHCVDPWHSDNTPWNGFLLDWPFDASQIETLELSHHQRTYITVDDEEPDAEEQDRAYDQWSDTFRQLPALKSLKVTGIPTSELELLLDALCECASPAGDVVCPHLSSLEIFNVQISDLVCARLLHVAVSRTPEGTRTSTLKRVELFNSRPSESGTLVCRGAISFAVELVIDQVVMSMLDPAVPPDRPDD